VTIFDSGYREFSYRPTPMLRRLWALSWLELRGPFRTRWGTILFLVCLIPLYRGLFVLSIWAGLLSFGGGEPGARAQRFRGLSADFDPTDAGFYLGVAMGPPAFVFVLLLTTLVSARAIAKDRGAQGLEILWTRGIEPVGYFLAKWFGSFLLIGLATVLGPLLLLALAWSSAPDEEVARPLLALAPRVALALVVFTAVLTGFATALSALARSANLAAILWVVSMVGSVAVSRVFARLFPGEAWLRALSPWDSAKRVAESIAGVTPRLEFPPAAALFAVLAAAVLLGVLVGRRLRTAEAVG
jgi:ABC-type transport system involved in multi-copper enzyme maturation permease subunit